MSSSGGVPFDPTGIIWTISVENQWMMLQTKYQGALSCQFRPELFLTLINAYITPFKTDEPSYKAPFNLILINFVEDH